MEIRTLDQVLTDRATSLRLDVHRKDSGEKLITHVPTGFDCIDNTYGGIRRGVCTELMAHTGDGKSAFAKQVCEATAKAGGGVLWFCGEDPEDATAERFFAEFTDISATDMGRLDLSNQQLDKIDQAAKVAAIWARRVRVIFEAPSVTEVIDTLNNTETVGDAPLSLGVYDYAQIFGDSASLESEIARLSTSINILSGQRRIANLLLSQVSSDVLKRGRDTWNSANSIHAFTPTLGDTEWCRRAEKSCKAVWSLIRPGRWLREMGEDCDDNYA